MSLMGLFHQPQIETSTSWRGRGNSGWWGTLKMHTVQFDLSVIKEDWVQCHHLPPQHRKAVVQLMSGPHCLAYR